MLDLRIDNAEIYDGTGAKPFNGSLGIKNGKIVSIGESKKCKGTIECRWVSTHARNY